MQFGMFLIFGAFFLWRLSVEGVVWYLITWRIALFCFPRMFDCIKIPEDERTTKDIATCLACTFVAALTLFASWRFGGFIWLLVAFVGYGMAFYKWHLEGSDAVNYSFKQLITEAFYLDDNSNKKKK